MQTPFEQAWLLLKQGVSPIGPDSPMHGYDEERRYDKRTISPLVQRHYYSTSDSPTEPYAEKIKRLMAEEESRDIYSEMPAPLQTADLDLR